MKLGYTGKTLFIVLCAFIASSAFAENLRVYKDRYIVTLNSENAVGAQSTRAAADNFSMMGLAVKDQLDSDTLVVGPENFGVATRGNEVVDFDANNNFCTDLLASGLASSCSPDYEVSINAVPNDTSYSQLWGMKPGPAGSDAQRAWDAQIGSSNTLVAVIDTGVDYNHPDLKNNMWTNPGEIPGDGIDNDGNGYIDDVHGWNASSNNGNPMDDNGHGTHCAGTIAGSGNNGKGVAGVMWKADIVAIKFLNANGSGSLSNAIKGINYAVALNKAGHDLKILSNSWGGGGFVASLEAAIMKAAERDMLFVAAAGNSGSDNDAAPHYPSSYDVENVIAVAAIDSSGNMANFSNYGYNTVDIAAPGVAIYSTYPGGGYKTLSGTSMATPHVAGALGLMKAHAPGMSGADLQDRLYYSGVGLPTLQNLVVTNRTLNVGRMIYNEGSTPSRSPNGGSGCEYDMQNIPYAPSSDASGQSILMSADEYNFKRVDLQFNFPFHGVNYSSFMVSPNGQIYFGSAPTSMDYKKPAGNVARGNSIAAMLTDMYANGAPNGVRVFSNAHRAVIEWTGYHFSMKTSGSPTYKVTLELGVDGRVKSYISFNGSSVLENAVNSGGVIVGLKGVQANSAFTSNVDDVTDGSGVQFTPNCQSAGPSPAGSITAVGVYRATPAGANYTLKTGKKVNISVLGNGTSVASLRIGDGSRWCNNSSSIMVSNGKADYSVKLRRFMFWKRFTAQVTGQDGSVIQSDTRKVRASRAHRAAYRARSRSKRTNFRVSNSRFQNQCNKLFSSLKSE